MKPAEACPDLALIEQLVADELEPAPSANLRRHVTTCLSCARQVDELRADRDLGERLRRALGGVNDARLPEIEGYRVVREIGRGGMGVVYEAEQIAPKRRVALKVVRGAQFVDAQTLRLFQREIRVLARLEHPGIAALYGAGETRGEHWFAMEFVDGKALTLHARGLDVETKLERFLDLCDAIDYAHRHGVVHRDLKPSNVLVTDAGRVQVLDFGLAKITDSDITLATEAGHIRGTLAYMSPEQARGDPAAVGTQSDVYSLGVILYELLCDALPIDTSGVAIHEAARRVADDAPRRPSAIDPKLRGDLETIVLKALAKDPHRRYAGAAALREDVRRFLADEVILARPPSALYEVRKFATRHKLPFALAAVVVVGSVGTAIWTSILYGRESDLLAAQSRLSNERQEALVAAQQANEEAQRATKLAVERLEKVNLESDAREASLAFLIDIFSDVRPAGGGRPLSADELLKRGIERLRDHKGDSAATRMMLLASVGSAATRAGLFDEASTMLEEAVDIARRDYPGHPALGSALASLGLLRREQGRNAESIELLEESEAIFAAREGTKSKNSITARTNYAQGLRESGNSQRAAEIAREALAETEPTEEWRTKRVALQAVLGLALYDLRENDEARGVLTAAIAEHEPAGPSVGFANLVHALGIVLYAEGRLDESREKLQTALDMRLALLEPDDDAISTSYNALAAVANEKGEYAAALDWMAKATAIQGRHYGPDSPQVAMYEFNRARILIATGDVDAAEELLLHALDVRKKTFGNDSSRIGETLVALGEIALKRQDTSAAERLFDDALRIFDVKLGKPHPSTLQARFRLVQTLAAAKRLDEARTLLAEMQVVARTSKQLNATQLKAIEDLGRQLEKSAGEKTAEK